jgi:type II secretory pathway pseudopilin PulG
MRRRPRRAGSPTAAAGTTLVELILAVFMLGTSTVTILGAFATLIKTSDLTRKTGDAGSTLAAVAEAVADNGRNAYVVSCNPPGYNPIAGVELPDTVGPGDATIVSVKYWNGAAFVEDLNDPINHPNEDCFDDRVPAWRLQLIEVRVHTSDGKVDRTISVVKRG